MISGFFDPAAGPYPLVTVALRVPLLSGQRWIAVPMVIDTGAMHSALHPEDVLGFFDIDPATLARAQRAARAIASGGVGGTATYFECPAQYGFAGIDGAEYVFDGEIWLAQPTPANRYVPSLLGWDVLRHFRIEIDSAEGPVRLRRR